ncbi:MAG: hypothetical protein V7676_14315 [Parasphingorhabdus sp.]|uniref:hypothetical protein n=1 Tax=Parasphingorhabdus sp. TaxID=2709688 RepID=UPI003001CA18
MKSILLYINDDPGQKVRLQAALDLTCSLEGRLHCLCANPYNPQMAFNGVTCMSVMYEIGKYAREVDQKLREFIESRLTEEGLRGSKR